MPCIAYVVLCFYRWCFSLDHVHVCLTHVCVRTCQTSTCVRAGVRAYPHVCVCTFLGSARELMSAEKTASVAEETDIDAEESNQQAAVAEESSVNRGVTDLDATVKTSDPNPSESKVSGPSPWLGSVEATPALENSWSVTLCSNHRFPGSNITGLPAMPEAMTLN